MTTFIFVDPTTSDDLAQACQTCSETFKSNEALRCHIAKYQLKEQRLLARLLEVQAHLPRGESLCRTEKSERPKEHASQACQTCFETFDSNEALRCHIAQYQHEKQKLVAVLPDIQAHSRKKTPRSAAERASGSFNGNHIGNTSSDDYSDNAEDDFSYNGIYSDDDDVDYEDDNVYNHDLTHDTTEDKIYSALDQASIPCPHGKCRKKQRKFATRGQLLKHFQSHAVCLQICVYCRDISTKVSTACRHDCDDRQEAQRNERNATSDRKNLYRADRREQLPRQSEDILNEMLARVSTTQKKKRRSESVHRNQELNVPKRLKGNPAHTIGLNGISVIGTPLGYDGTGSVEAQLFPSELPQMNSCQIDWNNPNIDSTQVLNEYAPIFGDGTIPPVYSATSYSNMAFTGALPEYPPIFKDGTIPPVYSATSYSNIAFTGAPSECPSLFEDGTIAPLYLTSSHTDIAVAGVPSEDEVVRPDSREIGQVLV